MPMKRAYLPVVLWAILGACGGEEPELPAPELRDSIAEAAPPIAVWLDVDPAIGIENGEVDDGLAMIQAFHSPEIAVRGVSVVYGNTTFENAVPIARELVERFGAPGLGVFPGASDATQLGE
jgi:hypothetical protein